MKIERMIKNKKDYTLFFDNRKSIHVLEDTIVKHRLVVGKEIDYNILLQIEHDNQFSELYGKALRYLSIRMRSKQEMEQYLSKRSDNYQPIIKKLEQEHYLDDNRFSKAYISDKFRLTTSGPLKIKQELMGLQLPETMIDNNLCQISEQEEQEKIKRLAEKKIKANTKDSAFKLRGRLFQYFITLGYHPDQVNKVFDQIAWKNNQALEKEYQKLKRKWGTKYQGEELSNLLKTKLYQKGFTPDEINEYCQ